MKKRRDRERADSGPTWVQTMARLLVGGLVASAVLFLVLLIGAFAISTGIISQQSVNAIILTACCLGSMVGALITVDGRQPGALLKGMGVGIVLFLMIISISTLCHPSSVVASGGVTTAVACICGGSLAGLIKRLGKQNRR